jgi:hypothetical protein
MNNQNSPEPDNNVSNFRQNGEFYLVPGEIMVKRPKAVAFRILGKEQIWIPITVVDQMDNIEKNGGLWIKEWFIRKNSPYFQPNLVPIPQ